MNVLLSSNNNQHKQHLNLSLIVYKMSENSYDISSLTAYETVDVWTVFCYITCSMNTNETPTCALFCNIFFVATKYQSKNNNTSRWTSLFLCLHQYCKQRWNSLLHKMVSNSKVVFLIVIVSTCKTVFFILLMFTLYAILENIMFTNPSY